VHIDDELLDVGEPLIRLLYDHGITHVSVREPRSINDRSWEMAAALCAMRRRPVFATGTVESYGSGRVVFGPIGGLEQKIKYHNGLQLETYDHTVVP